MTADSVDRNGNLYPHEEIERMFKQFIDKPVTLNYGNETIGRVIDAQYIDKAVEVLVRLDSRPRDVSKEKDVLAYQIWTSSVKCEECGCVATREDNACEHIKNGKPQTCYSLDPKSVSLLIGNEAADTSVKILEIRNEEKA